MQKDVDARDNKWENELTRRLMFALTSENPRHASAADILPFPTRHADLSIL
jgi:hypothetical protein